MLFFQCYVTGMNYDSWGNELETCLCCGMLCFFNEHTVMLWSIQKWNHKPCKERNIYKQIWSQKWNYCNYKSNKLDLDPDGGFCKYWARTLSLWPSTGIKFRDKVEKAWTYLIITVGPITHICKSCCIMCQNISLKIHKQFNINIQVVSHNISTLTNL